MAANPTTSVERTQMSHTEVRAQIDKAFDENSEGIVEALGLLQALQERGVLPLVRALVEQGDDVLKVILALFQSEEYGAGVKNFIGLLQLFTKIPTESMESVIAGVGGGMKAASEAPEVGKFGVYDALKSLQDPDVARAISFGLAFLKGMGRSLAEVKQGGEHA
ncbi:DUF1641 domain-containing protein [Alicyclobacillus dauci]|uniref:DUF1641 domain-containing protein n=1 Tax=Alicyclobacillus dauci TaxID=1475485 RepID=A0ABY6Z7L5_9BACL|nr:DUF1641 domain-containing protein [Alicyclobacillus dauci]WAH38784.1 DUF1641 domain-containing protein [Alicyclobacillus dauci]